MAARIRKIRHDGETRAKIQASQLVNRLKDHVLGKIDLTPSQVRAAEVLLRKCLPDLSSIEHSGEIATPSVVRAPNVAASTEEWQQQHAPPTLQ